MKRLRGFEDRTAYKGCCLSIGNFDGVHRGHRVLLSHLVECARREGSPAVVLTFEPHPLKLLHPESCPPRLTTADQKANLLSQAGVDVVIEYETDWNLLELSPGEFFERIIVEELAARGMVEGPNFFFGKRRAGTVETLRQFCSDQQIKLDIVTPAVSGTETVSSSLIRQALAAGDVETATSLLGRCYSLTGTVDSGAQRGRTIGFPTANLHHIETLIPAEGVYAGTFRTTQGKWPAAVNIGPNPTFSDDERKVEAHLLDFSGDLYGETVELTFVRRIREVRQFNSPLELQQQLSQDVTTIRKIFRDKHGSLEK